MSSSVRIPQGGPLPRLSVKGSHPFVKGKGGLWSLAVRRISSRLLDLLLKGQPTQGMCGACGGPWCPQRFSDILNALRRLEDINTLDTEALEPQRQVGLIGAWRQPVILLARAPFIHAVATTWSATSRSAWRRGRGRGRHGRCEGGRGASPRTEGCKIGSKKTPKDSGARSKHAEAGDQEQ